MGYLCNLIHKFIILTEPSIYPYAKQALVRKADDDILDVLPRSVEIVVGDVGDANTLKAAVEGCNKIIYCATARSTITADLFRVDHQGVYNITKAFQVCLSVFINHKRNFSIRLWIHEFVPSFLTLLVCANQCKNEPL